MDNKLTPGPWKWVFMGSAGNYYLVGNNGEGPVTHSGPDCVDGRLKEAAPLLLAALELAYGTGPKSWYDRDNETGNEIRAAIAAAKGE